MNKNILFKLAELADELDSNNFVKEADIVTDVMTRVAQSLPPQPKTTPKRMMQREQMNKIVKEYFGSAKNRKDLDEKFDELSAMPLFQSEEFKKYLQLNRDIYAAKFQGAAAIPGINPAPGMAIRGLDARFSARNKARYERLIKEYKSLITSGDNAGAERFLQQVQNAPVMQGNEQAEWNENPFALTAPQRSAFSAQATRIRLESKSGGNRGTALNPVQGPTKPRPRMGPLTTPE